MHVILASGSPRRRDLLRREGVRFEVRCADVDESLDDDVASRPHDAAMHLAARKAGAVAKLVAGQLEADVRAGKHVSDTLVIGSDTMVVLEGRIFGKPVDWRDAAEMLESLSGRTHEVVTGVSVWRVHVGRDGVASLSQDAFEETARVTFRELSAADIADYLACGESFDKAGAYAVQGEGARLVSGFEGDRDAIVGLPVKRLIETHPELLEA